MHKQLAAKIVINAKLRLTEGDCLVTQQVGPEILEDCILELERMNQELAADLNRYKTDDRLEPKPTYEQLEKINMGLENRLSTIELRSADSPTYEQLKSQLAESTLKADADSQDAKRYRFLREADPDAGTPYCTMHKQNSWGNWGNTWESGNELDAAIDAAMKEEK